jgi:glycosyltransferase involved in cell wall biosynthesis
MVIQGFSPKIGGAELQLERLLPRLAERGVSAVVLTRAFGGRPRRERVHGAEVVRTRVAGDGPLASAVYVATCLGYLLRHRRKLDLVHAHGALSEGAIALAARALGLPVLVKILRAGHQGDFELLAARPAGRLRTRLLSRSATFVALSDESRAELTGQGVPPERVLVIPNGVDTDAYRPAGDAERAELRRDLGLDDGPLVLYVGRLIDVKNVDTVVRALPELPGVRFLALGDGPERHGLIRLAGDLGVTDRASFPGATGRVAEHLRAADVFVLPSRSEGLSNSLLEAMASGLACIGTPVSGTRALLADGRGVLVEPGDVEAWTEALRRLTGDADLRRDLGEAAARHVQEHHSIDTTADRLVAAYERLR